MVRHHGFTLVELSAALGVAATISLISVQESSFETSQLKSRALGAEIFQYNLAVGRYMANKASKHDEIGAGVSQSNSEEFIGSSWLKGPDCDVGDASSSFLDCNYLIGGQTNNFNIEPRTEISVSSQGNLISRTVWAPSASSESLGGTELGVAAMVASASYLSMDLSDGSAYQGPTVYCPDISSYSHTIEAFCQSDANRIISTSSSSPSLEMWLRTDHGNTMQHVMEFSESPSSQSDLDDVDDGSSAGSWGGSGMRQIVNVARIYNRGNSGSDALILGSMFGSGSLSDSFITSNSLLEDSVIIDGDAGVMSDLYVNASSYIGDLLEAENDIRSVSGNIVAESGDIVSLSGDVLAGNNVRSINDVMANRDILANRDIRAGRDVYGSTFRDIDDPTVYRIKPSGFSRIDRMRIDGNVDIYGTTIARDGIRIANTSYASLGGSCPSNGEVRRYNSQGGLAQCLSGNWVELGGVPSGTYAFFGTNSCPSGWTYANGANGTRDLRNQFIRGTSSSRNAGNIQGDAIRNISGRFNARIYSNGTAAVTGTSGGFTTGPVTYGGSLSGLQVTGSYTGYRTFYFRASDAGVPTANENRPRNIAMRPCMKL